MLLLKAFFVYNRRSRCPPFLFISDEHIVKQSKQVCYKIIFINSLFIIIYDFLKIFNIVGNLRKKCGHHEKSWRKVGVKVATFLTDLLSCTFGQKIKEKY